ncbi:MAG TPA: hypothetical protein VFF85_03640, partial [Microbacterium sp.]|nr:hypothetical protein [Microbacterium sp.]
GRMLTASAPFVVSEEGTWSATPLSTCHHRTNVGNLVAVREGGGARDPPTRRVRRSILAGAGI